MSAPQCLCETYVGDDGDEGVGDGERQALWRAPLEALLHEGEAVLPAEQTDVPQQVKRHLHVLSTPHITL